MSDYLSLRTSKVIARKKHKCNFCGAAIRKGERYERWIGIYDAEFSSTAVCKKCFSS